MALNFRALHLYTAPLSGCSARIRIASHLKSIPLTYHTIDISKSEQSSSSYLAINPNGRVPSLIVEASSNERFTITQSPAILDFLSGHFPEPPLLPGTERPRERARVMELASLVACDIQPPQNSSIRKKITQDFSGDSEAWARWVYERGFSVYETFLETGRKEIGEGKYSVGDAISLADIFLVPAVQGGLRVGVNPVKWPILNQVVRECWKLEAFRKGGLGGHGKLLP
ncbi:thioredoxin-like protein [Hyaloscypha variabilis F]|uniref:Thioredoxin-like protein n=1 Tax=Hyaloscypha variabilis (strain UAMH 11265 / GT02V1 / F) TaxID=1149755 RepID=A0A2J6SC66_HYAVF|nr:thioredoxin-like protein [Hyaloscypha variabilis F]